MPLFHRLRQKSKYIFFLLLTEFSEKFDIASLKKFTDIFFTLSEKITIKLDYFLSSYIKYYDEMINREIKLVDISEVDRIIHVGCGSIPASSILIAQKTNAKITGIDKDKKAVQNARICIDKFGLSDTIQIKHSEASNFTFNSFNVILISQGITPKDIFFKNLSKLLSKDARIIFRTFSTESGGLEQSDKIVNDFFEVDEIIKHEKQGKVISVKLSMKK